jgi:hypothetical protein
MMSLVLLCLIIYVMAYFCLKISGQPIQIEHIHSVEDYFIDSKVEIIEDRIKG